MTKLTVTTLFSGGGGADIGLHQSGLCELVQGFELDPGIAAINQYNICKIAPNHQLYIGDILGVDPNIYPATDILWVSPPCTNFSKAKSLLTRGETSLDRALAAKIIEFITCHKPPYFILENVLEYKYSESLAQIENALFRLGYWCNRQVIAASDLGVPQSRQRLILRAIKGNFPLGISFVNQSIGWYDAVKDLLPTTETNFADWQLEKLPNKDTWTGKSFIVHPTEQRSMPVRYQDDPCFTIKANTRFIPAYCGEFDQVFRLATRHLARLQTFPDWYELEQFLVKDTTRLIGNAVPCLMAQKVIESMVY